MPIGNEKKIHVIALVILVVACPMTGFGQYLTEEEEAPKALLAAQLGSSDVELFIDGSWEASLFGSLGIAIPKDIPPFSAQYPGMVRGFAFSQEPDLLLSLWVEKRYFFETSILAGYELNSLQLGYVNPGEGFLRQLILGVPAPPINSYGDIRFTEGGKNTFGVSVETATELSRHDATLRIEDFGLKTKKYVGSAEIVETSLRPDDYIRGRFFVLPDEEIDFLQVFVETLPSELDGISASDGRFYAPLSETSYRASAVNGTIVLNERATKRVLVYYEKNGTAVGSPGLGGGALTGITDGFPDTSIPPVDFSFSSEPYLDWQMQDFGEEMEDGANLLVLYDPSSFSPFEHCGWYNSGFDLPQERINTRVELGAPGAPLPGLQLDFSQSLFDATVFRVFTSLSDSRSPVSRYPLAERYPFIYGPNTKTGDHRITSMILLRIEEETELYQLENPMTGSVAVRRNGFRETGFTVDESGVLTFDTPVASGERIDVIYRTEAGGENSQYLTFGLTSGFDIPGGLFTYVALSGTWNVNPGNFSTQPGQYPGAVTFGAGLDLNHQGIKAVLDASVSVSSQDTSGLYRIFGMESEAAIFSASRFNIFPAAPPSGVASTSHLTQANRGILFYKDYVAYGVSGTATLNRYDWTSLPPDQVFLFEDGLPTGPYAVSTAGDGVAGAVLALDYELQEAGHWAGAQMAILPGGIPPDLSSYEGFQFYWKTDDPMDDAIIYVQLGSLGEDLDGDNILDREFSTLEPGISFDDPVRNIQLTIGGRAGRPDLAITTEDTNGNGILDRETGHIVSRTYDTPGSESAYPETGWKKVKILFSNEERQLLHGATAFRIIVESTGAEKEENRLLVTGPTMLGSPFSADPLSAGTISIYEKTDTTLSTRYPELLSRLHGNDEPQRVLAFEWSDIDPGEGWTARGIARGTPIADYRRFSFYMRGDNQTAGDPELILALHRGDETAFTIAFPAPLSDKWLEYSIDLDSGDLLAGDNVIATGVLDLSVPVVDSISIECTGSPSGSLFLDEMHFAETKLEAGYSLQGGVSLSSPGPLLSIGEYPVLSNPYLDLDVTSSGGVIGNGPAHANALFKVALGADMATIASVSMFLDGDVGESFNLAGGHGITIPAVSSPITLTENFKTTLESEGSGFFHHLALSGGAPGLVAGSLSAEATTRDDSLIQAWGGSIDLFRQFPVSFSSVLSISRAKKGYAHTAELYFSKLREAFILLAPGNEGRETERTGSGSAVIDARGRSFGINVTPELAFRASDYPEGIFGFSGRFSVDTPITLAFNPPPGLLIEPYYHVDFENTAAGYSGNDLSADLSALGEGVMQERHLLTGPIYDLFAPDLQNTFTSSTDGSVSASYTPAAGISVSRGYGSYLRDLIIPAKFEIEFKRSLLRAEDLVTNDLTAGVRLRSTAINLFGSRGAYPFFSFYESDEYSWNSGFTANIASAVTNNYEILLQHLLLFAAGDHTQASISNRTRVIWGEMTAWEETLEAVFSWITAIPNGISLPSINIALKKDVYFKHEESLRLDISGPMTGFGLLLGHSSELFLGDSGSLLGVLHIGVGYGDETWSLGLEGGLRAKVTL
jgi:hypothetical protein